MVDVIVLNDHAAAFAKKIADQFGGRVFGSAARCNQCDETYDDLRSLVETKFAAGDPIVAVMASGALIRLVCDHLENKKEEPPVIAIADDGSMVVPLLGGHNGGNDLAQEIATLIGASCAITTASDLRFGVALDNPPSGWTLANPSDYKSVAAKMLAEGEVRLQGRFIGGADWLLESRLPIDDDAICTLSISETERPAEPNELVYIPRRHVIGIGCERGTDAQEVIGLLDETLDKMGLSKHAISCVTSIDVKADETAVHAAAAHLGVPARFFDAATLEAETPRLKNPSEIVFEEVGCHGVAEGAALAATGSSSELVQEKRKSKRATVAIAKSEEVVDPVDVGRAQGRLFVVGIGPGQEAWRSPEVSAMISKASDLVGYSLYLDLVSEISVGKIRHDFDLGKEEDRVRHAMELSGTGKDVALVCSGDAGIYAMATLVFELLADGGMSDAARRIAVEVSPGISALQAAAARAGAPLGHDFCTISLSDLLTPWPAIEQRIKGAAEGDFVIAFYNPVSKRRRTQLAYAKTVLLEHRPADTPVILATNLGREGELVRSVDLAELEVDDVDMLTVVIVGSSNTKTITNGSGKTWVYTPRGYADKQGTGIKK